MHLCRPGNTPSRCLAQPTVVCGTCAASPMWRRVARASRRVGVKVTAPWQSTPVHVSPAGAAHQLDVTRHGAWLATRSQPAETAGAVQPVGGSYGQETTLPAGFLPTRLSHQAPRPCCPPPCLTAVTGTTAAARGGLTVAKANPWEPEGTGRLRAGAQRAPPQPQTQQPSGTAVPQLGSRAEFTGSVVSVTYYTAVRETRALLVS
jgi:hypothetical protein